MCKASLQADGTSTWGVNEFVEQSIKRLFPVDLMERQTGFEEEQLNEANIPSEEKFRIVYTFLMESYSSRIIVKFIHTQFLSARPASRRSPVLSMFPSRGTDS